MDLPVTSGKIDGVVGLKLVDRTQIENEGENKVVSKQQRKEL